jgi:hypothetical protein
VTSELGDDLEAEIVGPLEVLETHERRSGHLGEDAVDDVHDELAAADLFGIDRRIAQREEVAAEPFEARHPQHRSSHVEDRSRGNVAVLRSQIAPDSGEASLLGLLVDRIEEAGLADPRLARDEEELAAPREHIVEPSIGELDQLVSTDQQRAANGTD